MLRGITVVLHVKTQTGADEFGAPVYSDSPVSVGNVLVAPATAEEIVNSTQMHGKKAAYTLGIPKGDSHVWEDTEVEFFGKKFMTFGPIEEGIEDMVPLSWHRKVKVAYYE